MHFPGTMRDMARQDLYLQRRHGEMNATPTERFVLSGHSASPRARGRQAGNMGLLSACERAKPLTAGGQSVCKECGACCFAAPSCTRFSIEVLAVDVGNSVLFDETGGRLDALNDCAFFVCWLYRACTLRLKCLLSRMLFGRLDRACALRFKCL